MVNVTKSTPVITQTPASSIDSLPSVSHGGMPVITTELLAEIYGTETIRIQQNHKRNNDRFIAGKHFFKLEGTELKAFKNRLSLSESVGKRARSLVLWTERGAARHAKMLETDQAWEVFEKLEDCYFNAKASAVEQHKATKKAFSGKITADQQEAIKQLVLTRGKSVPQQHQAKATITLWSALKTHFGCSYKEINEDQFTEALSLAARVTIEGEFLGKQEALPESDPVKTNRRYLVCVRIKDELIGAQVELNISAETFASMVTGISTCLGYEPIGFNKVPAAKHLIKQIH